MANLTFGVNILPKANADVTIGNSDNPWTIVSPSLTGTPTAPTPTEGTSTDQIATTAFVNATMGEKADKVSEATEGDFAALDSNGNLVDSGHKHSDYLTSHQDISEKADKVSNATEGNFASLDANGNLTDSGHKHSDYLTEHQDISGKIDVSEKGTANGVAELDSTGKVPAGQLPGFVDDVLEFDSMSQFPVTGESGKIYIAKDTDITYRWGGSVYVPIGSDLALGETETTAYRGDRGKAAYDHATAKGSAFESGLYKIETNAEGHVTGTTPVTKADITALGIPGEEPDVTGKADKVANATNGNFAALDSNGNLTDSGHKHSDYLTEHQDITGKADKVDNATTGNFAGLDANGNLVDSGYNASSFVTGNKLESTAITALFDPETVYNEGDRCTYSGNLYQRNSWGQDTPVAEDWDENHWTEITVLDDVMPEKADKTDTVLLTTLSRGRKADSAVGSGSFAFGNDVTARGDHSHAEGVGTIAQGLESHAEGYQAVAWGAASHAEGYKDRENISIAGSSYVCRAYGSASHTEGRNTSAIGSYSHAEGYQTVANGEYSHAEGQSTRANAYTAHAEGYSTNAGGNNSHAEGGNTNATGTYSHVEGYGGGISNTSYGAHGYADHAEGYYTYAKSGISSSNSGAHAEGCYTKATAKAAHAEGYYAEANGYSSHAEGYYAKANGSYSHAEGFYTTANEYCQHVSGFSNKAYPIESVTITFPALENAEEYDPQKAGYKEGSIVKVGNTMYVCHSKYAPTKLSSPKNDTINWHTFTGTLPSGVTPTEWDANNTYAQNSYVKVTNPDATYTIYQNHNAITTNYVSPELSNLWGVYWHSQPEGSTYTLTKYDTLESVGAGASNSDGRNVRLLTMGGDEYLTGDVYVQSDGISKTGKKLAVTDIIANEYDSTATYAIGDYCIHDNKLYKCNTAISSAESWTAAHWTEKQVIDEIPDVSGKADKTDTVLLTTLSHGRKANTTVGTDSFAYGYEVTASYNCDHAEGAYTTASGGQSHAEGGSTTASGGQSHAEGASTTASGNQSHAEGASTTASGVHSHAEGYLATASNAQAHAEGYQTVASGSQSHAEGSYTQATGSFGAHAEGTDTISSGQASHAEGIGGTYTESGLTKYYGAYGDADHSEGYQTIANSSGSFSSYKGAHAEGYMTKAMSKGAHAEGLREQDTVTIDSSAYTCGAIGMASHSEGIDTCAVTNGSHAEGYQTVASGAMAHSEGYQTLSNNSYAHAEGSNTVAAGPMSHAEGSNSTASGSYTHAEGYNTTASAMGAHAENYQTVASGDYSHAEGYYTIASNSYQHAGGKNNVSLSSNYYEMIGNGTSSNARSNARALDWNGNEYLKGNLYVECDASSANGTRVAKTTEVVLLTQKGVANGVAELDANGLVPSSQLPSYVDDVVEFDIANFSSLNEWVSGTSYAVGDRVKVTDTTVKGYECITANSSAEFDPTEWRELSCFPATGENGKIYVDVTKNMTYRWSGSTYVPIGGDLTLGETSSTAYRGDRGKAAYDAAIVNPDSAPTENSTNLIKSGGVYTALQTYAPKASPVFTGSISLGRKSGTTVGDGSIAIGNDVTASGKNSFATGKETEATSLYTHAEGSGTKATATAAHAEGYYTEARSNYQHVSGRYNVIDSSNVYAEIIGNGLATNLASNARTLDWNGNERLKGDLYVGCNADSTGGTKVVKATDTMTGSTSSTAGTSGLVPAPSAGDQDKYLKGDGTWGVVSTSDMTGATASTAGVHGLVPAPSAGDENKVLAGDGTWHVMPFTETLDIDLTTVTNTSGSYSGTTTDNRVTADMKVQHIELGNRNAFNDDITITCDTGTVTLTCNDVSGTSTVRITVMRTLNGLTNISGVSF